MSRIVFGETPNFGPMVLQWIMLPLLEFEPFVVLGRNEKISAASSAVSCCRLEQAGLNLRVNCDSGLASSVWGVQGVHNMFFESRYRVFVCHLLIDIIRNLKRVRRT